MYCVFIFEMTTLEKGTRNKYAKGGVEKREENDDTR